MIDDELMVGFDGEVFFGEFDCYFCWCGYWMYFVVGLDV